MGRSRPREAFEASEAFKVWYPKGDWFGYRKAQSRSTMRLSVVLRMFRVVERWKRRVENWQILNVE